MARSQADIQQELITAVQADPVLSGITSPSGTAIWRLWTYITSIALETFEQLLDVFTAEIEQIAREAVPGTAGWLQRRVLEFQYDAVSPQVISVVDGVATYPIIDPLLRIITRAAVKEQINNRALVKVAKDDGAGGLEPLDPVELNALKGYIDKIGFIGIAIDSSSLFADRLRFAGEIFYLGEYVETTVKAAVIVAITDYLSSVSVDDFDGKIVREQIIDAIQSVQGVAGIDTLNVSLIGRPNSTPLSGSTTVISREYETAAGYIIEEDTAGNTFDDLIVMTLQTS
tara:strand:- start:966 stop:1823 length:858 start_codon:yes stop_codon:yes gene_type:complete